MIKMIMQNINKYRVSVGLIDNKNAVVNLSQIKNIDSKRLIRKVDLIPMDDFNKIMSVFKNSI